jgi:ABC-type phosphate transport system substrate-binding protein
MKKIIILTAFFVFLIGIKVNAQVAVIANKSVSENSITNDKLADIYLSKTKTWDDGSRIVRFTCKTDNDISGKFFSTVGKSHADMKKLWMKLQLTGAGQAPDALGSDEETINVVSSTPGAIGFIDAKKVNDKVKVLLTIN